MLSVLAACAGEDPSPATDPGEYSEWDSAGIRIVESSAEALETPLAWVDTVPNLELGQAAGAAEVQFHNIRGIVGLPDGGLVVLNAGSRELRWFDSSGELVSSSGRAGEGPGEFLDPILVPQFDTDSLLIFDQTRRTFTQVAIDGSGGRSVSSDRENFRGTPEAAAGSRALFRTISRGFESCPENEGCEIPFLLRSVDVTGTLVDTLAVYPNRMMRYMPPEGPEYRVLGALSQSGLAAAGPEGLVVEGDPRFELKQFDSDGQLRAMYRVTSSPLMTPEEALDRFVQRYPDPDAVRDIYELAGLPEVVPAFQTLRVDHLGWYWAELLRLADEDASEWLVFDPEGRALGVVEVPRGLEVHDIGEDYILGRWSDDLGVEHVRRYSMERRRR